MNKEDRQETDNYVDAHLKFLTHNQIEILKLTKDKLADEIQHDKIIYQEFKKIWIALCVLASLLTIHCFIGAYYG